MESPAYKNQFKQLNTASKDASSQEIMKILREQKKVLTESAKEQRKAVEELKENGDITEEQYTAQIKDIDQRLKYQK